MQFGGLPPEWFDFIQGRSGKKKLKFGPFIIHDRRGDSDLLDLFGSLEELKKYLNIFIVHVLIKFYKKVVLA